MALISVIVLVCVADYTLGTECQEGQHCSQCDIEGDCLHGCDKGYFGMKCRSQCNIKCRYNTCKLDPGTGAGKCTAGCVPGYQGTNCDRPCDSHVVNCILCPGGCDGEYCQLGDACFAECRDSRYGSGCKTCPSNCRTCNRMTGVCDECDLTHHGVNCEMTCPSNCRTCNRMTGVCDECDPTHHGVNCEMTCENCAGSCESGCECVPGFYGDFCAETCSKTCRAKSAHKCLPAVAASDSCTGECDKLSATCLHGCVDGWFGPMCSSPCNPGCRHQRCDEASSCAEGCELHHFGSACGPCPENCTKRTCDSKSGSCVDGCRNGFYGEYCNDACTLCPHGVCDQNTGACVEDCTVSEDGSEFNCTRTCSRPGCSTGHRNSSLPKWPHISITTLTVVLGAVGFFLLAATAVCCFCFRKSTCSQRSTQGEPGTHNGVFEQADPNYMDYQEFQKYWEIREDEADLVDGIPNQNKDGTSDVSDDAMPVLADYVPGDVNDGAGDVNVGAGDVHVEAGDGDVVAGEGDVDAKGTNSGLRGSSVSDDDRYTHLTRDVPVADPRKVSSYISPLED